MGGFSFSLCRSKHHCLIKCQAAHSTTSVCYGWVPMGTVLSRSVGFSCCSRCMLPLVELDQLGELSGKEKEEGKKEGSPWRD